MVLTGQLRWSGEYFQVPEISRRNGKGVGRESCRDFDSDPHRILLRGTDRLPVPF